MRTMPQPDSFFDVGTTPVLVTVTDVSGNMVTGSFDVTVLDAEPPALDCPGDMTVSNAGGACGALVSYSVAEDALSFSSDCWPPENGRLAANGTTVFPERARDILVRDLDLMHGLSPFVCNDLPETVGSSFNGTDNDCDSFFDIYIEVSVDEWTPVDASGTMTVTGTMTSATSEARYFDTEMTQLNLAGMAGGIPVMIRESPTRASHGRITVTQIGGGGGGGGGYHIDS